LVFLTARRIFNRRVAIVAQLLCAGHPMLIWYTARIWVETVNTLAITIIVLALVLLTERLTFPRSIGAGAAVGMAALTKSIILLFPFAAGMYLLLRWGRESLPHVLLLIISVFFLVIPWTVRNYAVTGRIVPVQTTLGLNMVQGDIIGEYWAQKPYSTIQLWDLGEHKIDSLLSGTPYTATDPLGDRMLIGASLRHSFSHPLFFVKRTFTNFMTFWYLSESRVKSLFLICIQAPLVLCVILFSLPMWKRNPMTRPIVLLIAYYAVSHSLVVGWARYSVPILPASLIFVAHIVGETLQRIGPKRSSREHSG
jgi:4-amino-4-deoxy-L-arabinose transferase-like glycosyltransferase